MQIQTTTNSDVKYLYTAIEVQALCLMCTSHACAEVEQGIEDCLKKTEILELVENQVLRIIEGNFQKKADLKEFAETSNDTLDNRARVFQVDPINECLSLRYELTYIRYLFNELVISDDKFKAVINEDVFLKAQEFSTEFMKGKFPLVSQTKSLAESIKEEPVDAIPDAEKEQIK